VLDDLAHAGQDLDAKSIAHGVVHLEQMNPEYGAERRRLRVRKYRGMRYRGGFHDFIIRRGGLTVFPRLVATVTRANVERSLIASGVKGLDTLLGGGLERGASTLVTGAAGTGKSTIAATYAIAAAARGERAAIFLFDESIGTLIGRCRGLGLPVDKVLADGRLILEQVDPAELSPGQFAQRVADVASEKNCTLVVLDSMNGFLQAMPDERYLVAQLHVILSYLGQRGIATVVISVQQGLIGHMTNPVDASYLADAVVLLRYFEAGGCVRQAISVIKRRGGRHERSIREMWMDASGLKVGEPLAKFQGVLTGVPSYLGSTSALAGARSR
jgi:circadian clock protein KaiC